LRSARERWAISHEVSMQHDEACVAAYREAQELLYPARPDQVAEALRLLACEVAYAKRYHECLPLEELTARIAAAPQDVASMELISEGMAHLVEVLRRLRITWAEPTSSNTPTPGWGD
jgi:thioredoxin-like negative regulator of GroEL